MANIRLIRRRIHSIQNTAKITKAMEMVAASKMRRAQERALMSRPYAEKMNDVLAHLAAQPQSEGGLHPLLVRRPVNKMAIIHMTSDRGLCGGLNTNVNRLSGNYILTQDVAATLVTVGKKGRDFMSRAGREIRAEFTGISDRPAVNDILPIAHIVIEDYTSGLVDRVFVAYPQFRSTAVQQPVLDELLPIEPAKIETASTVEYIYEPNAATVLSDLLPRYVEMQLYHALLETIASEQSARMVAMRNATENANEMIQDLTLAYNKARQEMITSELLDITGGAAALK